MTAPKRVADQPSPAAKRPKFLPATPAVYRPVYSASPRPPGSVSAFDSFPASDFTSWIDGIKAKAAAALEENQALDAEFRRKRLLAEGIQARKEKERAEFVALIKAQAADEEQALRAAAKRALDTRNSLLETTNGSVLDSDHSQYTEDESSRAANTNVDRAENTESSAETDEEDLDDDAESSEEDDDPAESTFINKSGRPEILEFDEDDEEIEVGGWNGEADLLSGEEHESEEESIAGESDSAVDRGVMYPSVDHVEILDEDISAQDDEEADQSSNLFSEEDEDESITYKQDRETGNQTNGSNRNPSLTANQFEKTIHVENLSDSEELSDSEDGIETRRTDENAELVEPGESSEDEEKGYEADEVELDETSEASEDEDEDEDEGAQDENSEYDSDVAGDPHAPEGNLRRAADSAQIYDADAAHDWLQDSIDSSRVVSHKPHELLPVYEEDEDIEETEDSQALSNFAHPHSETAHSIPKVEHVERPAAFPSDALTAEEEDEMYEIWKSNIEDGASTTELPNIQKHSTHIRHGHSVEEYTDDIHTEILPHVSEHEILDETQRNFEVVTDSHNEILAVTERDRESLPMTSNEVHQLDAEQEFLKHLDEEGDHGLHESAEEFSENLELDAGDDDEEDAQVEESGEEDDDNEEEEKEAAENLNDFPNFDDNASDSSEMQSTGSDKSPDQKQITSFDGNMSRVETKNMHSDETSPARFRVVIESRDTPHLQDLGSSPDQSSAAQSGEDKEQELIHTLRDGLEYVDEANDHSHYAPRMINADVPDRRHRRHRSTSKTPQK